MELTIDKFGRILIPKKVREQLGMQPGGKVTLEVNEPYRRLSIATAELPVEQEIVYTDWGFPYIKTGVEPDEEFDTVQFTKEGYDEYFMRKLGF